MRALLASLSLMTFACSAESGADFKEDQNYKLVKNIQKPVDAKRITVEEFFWYGCQHCYALDPLIQTWADKKPADVDFVRVPASLGRPEGIVHQKTFYTAEALGLGEKMHKPFFDGIHQRHLPLTTQETIRNFFGAQSGVLPDIFDANFNGFTVDSRVRRAEALSRTYGVISVPTVVVGGKYMTNGSMNTGFPQMLDVVSFLVDKVRKERKK
jgi:thiol:disulfide interchange protein DsbA